MERYKDFKIGDKVRHKFRENKYQNCIIKEINEDKLPLILVEDNNGEHLLPYMDLDIILLV